MSESWIDIKDQKPDKGQEVWYYFHGNVYAGRYYQEYYWPGTLGDVFYGKSGFLTNDVKYWMPRSKGQEKPIFEVEYDESKYFVDGTE